MSTSALTTMVAIDLRTGWRALLTWVLALAATTIATTVSISGLYDTQAEIDSYASAVGSGDAMVAINGEVAGIDTLGGVVANEFGFLASFAVPLMGISIVARMTRKDEEHGRLEALLAGRIGRSAPLVAAVLVTTGALVLTGGALLAGLVLVGVPVLDSLLYAASMAALGFVFACVAGLVAQLAEHARGVYAAGLGVLVVSYLLRGIGDVMDHPVTWLSPLGWQQETRAFGEDPRWWPLVVPVAVGLVLFAVAGAEAGRRDLGSAILRRGGSAAGASSLLRTSPGLALRIHRTSIAGWAIAALIVAGTFGALAQSMVDAFAGNASLSEAMGAGGGAGIDAVLSLSVLLLGLIGSGYAVQSVGLLRAEESSGRLEATLAGSRARWSWLGAHVLVVLVGTVVVLTVGAFALVVAVAWSTGEAETASVARAVAAYLPAVLVFAGLALVLFGILPRAQPAAWLLYGLSVLVAFLGEPLQLSDAALALTPFHHVGSPPQDGVDVATLAWLSATALGLAAAGFVGFRGRAVPRA